MELTSQRFYQAGPPNLGYGPYHAESTNGRSHNHQQRHPQEVDQWEPPATAGRLQEQTYPAHNSLPDGLFNGNRVVELEHGIPPPPPHTTSTSTYGSVGGSHDGRTRKAPRTVNVSMHK